jgi:hypothetical protein
VIGRGLLAALSAALVFAPSALGSPERALSDLNAWRAGLGLAPVTRIDPAMSEGCRLHNRYLKLHPNTPDRHFETPKEAGATPAGQVAGRFSVLAWGATSDDPRGIWEGSVFHRASLLHPRLRTTWWSFDGGYACMGTVGTDSFSTGYMTWPLDGTITPIPQVFDNRPQALPPAVVTYPSPADGATGVPTEFPGHETPDPRELIPGKPERVGWLLSVGIDGPWTFPPELTVAEASLVAEDGRAVPVTGIGDSGDMHSSVGVFPHAPLRPKTRYIAHVAGRAVDTDGAAAYDFARTWSFTTAVAASERPRPTPLAVRTTIRRGRLVVRLATRWAGAKRRGSVTVSRRGAQVARRAVVMRRGSATVRFAAPVGRPVKVRVHLAAATQGRQSWSSVTKIRTIR